MLSVFLSLTIFISFVLSLSKIQCVQKGDGKQAFCKYIVLPSEGLSSSDSEIIVWLERKDEPPLLIECTLSQFNRTDMYCKANFTTIVEYFEMNEKETSLEYFKLKDDILNEKRPIRGVNLAGWLVAESWITTSFSNLWHGVPNKAEQGGEYTTMAFLGHKNGDARFEEHRRTFITEDDFRQIAEGSLNKVIIPVGYWIADTHQSDPDESWKIYAPGALKYLDLAIMEWAPRHNLFVVINLQAARGIYPKDIYLRIAMFIPKWSLAIDHSIDINVTRRRLANNTLFENFSQATGRWAYYIWKLDYLYESGKVDSLHKVWSMEAILKEKLLNTTILVS